MDDGARKPLLALALAAFGIGTTEFVIMGLLPDVAADLAVTIPAAGVLVSGYALGVAFGGPFLAVLLARVPGRRALLLLMGLFVVGNIGCAIAPGYGWLMAARVLTAFCHAAFFGIGAVIAAGLAPPGKRAQAIALMIGGLTVATVLGVPLGTLIGQAAGWRATFWAVALIGLIACAGLALWLPESESGPRDIRAELRSLRSPPVWMTLLISVIASTSMFTFFTYITPILTDVSAVARENVSWVLLACGIGLTLGNFLGAKLADWRALPSLTSILFVVAIVLFGFTRIGPEPVLATVAVVLWGIAAFSVCAVLQAEVVEQARAAPNLASTLNISAFNLGNAIGAGLGAFALSRGLSLAAIPVLAGIAAVFALVLTGLAITLAGRFHLSR